MAETDSQKKPNTQKYSFSFSYENLYMGTLIFIELNVMVYTADTVPIISSDGHKRMQIK